MLASFYDSVRVGATIDPGRLADRLHLPMSGLAKLARVSRNTLSGNAASRKVQQQLGPIAEIMARATELAGDADRAVVWFKHVKITGFGKSAEQLVAEGREDAVLWYFDTLDAGVFA